MTTNSSPPSRPCRLRPPTSRSRENALQIPLEDGVACEERDDPAEGEKRSEGDCLLAGRAAVAHEKDDGGHGARDETAEEPDDDAEPEPHPEQERELDVSHTHPLRVGEDDEEERDPGAEAAKQPGKARLVQRPQREHDERPRKHDAVGDEAVLEI